MTALSKPTTDFATPRPVSTLAIVSLFSLVGLAISLAFARYGIDIAVGM
ncbi:hypothetical protein [Bradyrhizobium genosp. P]